MDYAITPITEAHIEQAQDAGYAAGMELQRMCDNPHVEDSPLFHAWREGWVCASMDVVQNNATGLLYEAS